MPTIDFRAEADRLRELLIARRRDLHRHPELAFEERRTAGIVADTLMQLGLEVQTGVGKTGVIGLLEGDLDGPTVLVRADMDALPVLEENDVEYASTMPGTMHACGHDGHTAIALGVAQVLSQYRDRMAGRVKFVFQPAEEVVAGAKAMIADGALENPRPDVCLGLHLWNGMPLGSLGVADGPVMAGSSAFTLKISGKGGHAAAPHSTVDPVVCAAQIISGFQTIVSRNVNPLDGAVVSVTWLQAGTAFNVIPQEVEMRGTIRTFELAVRDRVEQRMREISTGIASAMGCTCELQVNHHVLPVINHPEVGERLRPVFERYVGAEGLNLNERTMGSEDVGLFMSDIPGMYFFLGAALADRDVYYGHHHPRFDFDEEALPLGVTLLAAAVAEYVLPEQ